MKSADLRERITEQYSYGGPTADVWHGLDLVLDTDSFLNLGYSRWYQPHFVGSSQRRLVSEVGVRLESQHRKTDDLPLLDVGCGRGGPAVHLSNRFGFDVTGVDLVPYNVAQAAHNADRYEADARFVVGDATSLPFATETMAACTAIDSLVYVPDRALALSEIADVLVADGVVVVSDLVSRSERSEDGKQAVEAFADAWDMPPPATVDDYRRLFVDAGLGLRSVEEITQHSVGRFRKWTTLFLGLLASPVRSPLLRLLRWYGLDPETIVTQVQRAHAALPYLDHVLFVARK